MLFPSKTITASLPKHMQSLGIALARQNTRGLVRNILSNAFVREAVIAELQKLVSAEADVLCSTVNSLFSDSKLDRLTGFSFEDCA